MQTNIIYNADCMQGMKRMRDQSVDLVLTDVPYGNVTKMGEERAKYAGQLRKIDKADADVVTFDLVDFLEQCSRITKGSIYIFCGIEQISEIYSYFDNHADFMVRQCGWRKTNPSPSNGQHMWVYTLENCVFAKRRKTKFYALCKPSIWDYPVIRDKIHPTQKPVELFQNIVLASTDENDIVFDPCMGSGTTAIAAINTNRKYIGYELNAEYHASAEQRIAAHTQQEVPNI